MTLALLLTAVTGAWAQKRGGINDDASVAKARIMAKTPRRASAIPANATILYQQNFDDTNDINELGWTFVDNDGDGLNWTMSINGKYDKYERSPSETSTSVPNCLYSQSFTDDGGGWAFNADNWAITPAIEIYESTILSFQLAYENIDYPDKVGVYVGETANVNEMTEVLPLTSFSRTDKRQYNEETVDLSAFAGKTCYIAFRHKDYDNYIVVIDDVVVYKPDPRFYSFTMPASDVDVDYELVRDMAQSVTATMNASIFRLMEDGQGGYKPVEGMPTPELTVKDELGTEAVTMTEGTTAAPADYTAVLQKLTSEEGAQEEEWTDVSAEDGPTLGTYRYAITGQGDYDGTIYTENFLMSLRIPAEISYAQTFLNKDKGDVFVNTLTNTGDGEVTYKLTGDNIATIDPETGKVTITGQPGVVTVTATVKDSGDYSYETKSVSYVISVGLPLANPPYDYDDQSIGAHKLALLTVINIAKEIDLTNKTDKSANKLRMTIAECEELLTSKTVTHEELDEARIRLLIAIDNLEDKAPADADADIANGQNQENEETTGVRPIDNGQLTIENWYTLNGRKLDKKPTKKGVYILNGKKVVIK